jgi:hypothetical protein
MKNLTARRKSGVRSKMVFVRLSEADNAFFTQISETESLSRPDVVMGILRALQQPYFARLILKKAAAIKGQKDLNLKTTLRLDPSLLDINKLRMMSVKFLDLEFSDIIAGALALMRDDEAFKNEILLLAKA